MLKKTRFVALYLPFGSGIVCPHPLVDCVPAGNVAAESDVALLHSYILPRATSHKSINPSGASLLTAQ